MVQIVAARMVMLIILTTCWFVRAATFLTSSRSLLLAHSTISTLEGESLPRAAPLTDTDTRFSLERIRARSNGYRLKPLYAKLKRGVRSRSRGLKGIKFTITNTLIAVNVLMFGLSKLNPEIQYAFMKLDNRISRGQTYRLFSSMFLHGSIYHLFVNCYSLSSLGPQAENFFGKARFLTTYLASGTLANVFTFLTRTSPASLGASGCIFGLMGAFAMTFYRNKRILGASADAGLDNIKRTLFMNVFYGMSMKNIDNWAHFSGFASGALFAYLFGPRLFRARSMVGGPTRIIDRPLLNYIRHWRALGNYLDGGPLNNDSSAAAAFSGSGSSISSGGLTRGISHQRNPGGGAGGGAGDSGGILRRFGRSPPSAGIPDEYGDLTED